MMRLTRHLRLFLAITSLALLIGCGGATSMPPRDTTQVKERQEVEVAKLDEGSAQPTRPASSPPPSKPSRQRVAVLELKNLARLDQGEVHYLSNLLRQAAGRLPTSTFLVMTNDSMEALLPPDVNLESCETGCAVDIGRTIQAHWILVGEVVRFGGALRVSLNLHDVKSGGLTKTAVVKGKDSTELEGPLQGAAVGMFNSLDPELARVAERLKRGFVFEKFQYEALPEIPQSPSSAPESAQSVALPKSINSQTIKGVNFGSVDVEGLELYDRAVTSDGDTSVAPEEKVKLWEGVASRVKGVASEARQRAKVWRVFIRERDEAEARRRAQERERAARRAELINRLRALEAEDRKVEAQRSAQMRRDWDKLSRLLKLRVVSAEDKLSWTEAFVEAYGAIPELNPHVGALSEWTSKMGLRFDRLKEESREEWARRARRRDEVNKKVFSLGGVMTDAKSGLTWVRIEGGSFMMGSNDGDSDEKPMHRVKVSSFMIAESEVTVAQYRKCVEAGVCTEPDTGSDHCTWGKSGKDDHPINCVDWGQARTFSRWVGGDLPTEAQWEYAARGGQDFKYAGSNDPSDVGWYGSRGSGTHPVKRKRANGYGLYDMSGNVWEWTLDEWHGSYSGAPSSGDQPWGGVPTCSQRCNAGSSRRVSRGGCWRSYAGNLRVADRNNYAPYRDYILGFRPAGPIP